MATEYGNSDEVSNNQVAAEFIASLLAAAPLAHILHLQTRSFAEHMALGTLYEELPEKVDALAEAYQGLHGLITDYPAPAFNKAGGNPVEFVQSVTDYVRNERAKVATESELQNLIDEIAELLDSTLYKLKFLA